MSNLPTSSADILNRVKALIPKRWFQWAAPYRDAVLGGLSDLGWWCYGLIGYARAQTRISTAYGIWLDIIAYDFLGRTLLRNGLPDDTFRAIIKATILKERVTRLGMTNAITALVGVPPVIFEPWNTFDTGAYSGGGFKCGQFGYGVGQGGYGSMALPAQTFMQVSPGPGFGIPGVGGYDSKVAGYGIGSMEYEGATSQLTGVTPQMIYDLINKTKPTGSICWVHIGINPILEIFSPAIFSLDPIFDTDPAGD